MTGARQNISTQPRAQVGQQVGLVPSQPPAGSTREKTPGAPPPFTLAPQRTAAQSRDHADRVHRWVRLGIQVVFFVFAPAVFSGAFNGVKYIFTQIGLVQGIELTSFVTLLIATLVFTIVFGRFFCGYACAFGTFGDVLHGIAHYIGKKTGRPGLEMPEPLVRALSLVKYVVLIAICLACVAGVWLSVSGASPWTAFAGILANSVGGIDVVAFMLLVGIMVGMVVRERFFCQFLCPLGAVFSLMPVFGFSEYTRVRAHCARSCGKCRETCPVDIWPDADTLVHGECISCGRCADVCPMNNVNMVAIEKPQAKQERRGKGEGEAGKPRPLRKTREAWYLLRGSGVGVVIAKAFALLLVCWVFGATRIVPSFASIASLFA